MDFKSISYKNGLKQFDECVGTLENIDLINDSITLRDRLGNTNKFVILDEPVKKQVLEQIVNLSSPSSFSGDIVAREFALRDCRPNNYYSFTSDMFDKVWSSVKGLALRKYPLKVLLNTQDNSVAGLSSSYHFQIFEDDINGILENLQSSHPFKKVEGPYTLGLEFDGDSYDTDLPVDGHSGVEWFMGRNIPQHGSGMKINNAFRIFQCSNWGIFWPVKNTLFDLPIENRLPLSIPANPGLFIRKNSKERLLSRVYHTLEQISTIMNDFMSETIYGMNYITLDDFEAHLLLDGYQYIHKITQRENELLFDIWSSETDHSSLWDLHQAFTYAFSHKSNNYNYQKIATDLMIHYPYFTDWESKNLIFNDLRKKTESMKKNVVSLTERNNSRLHMHLT